MGMLYWAGEYAKVFLAYFAVMFVWPSVVFYCYLKGKSFTVRFAFCTTVQIVLINTVVLGLGLLHLLHGWIVALLFYGVFLFSIFKRHRISPEGKDRLRRLKDGTYGTRLFLADKRKELGAWSKKKFAQFRVKVKGHGLEYSSLAVVVVFGMIYFSYGAFQNVCYGTSDMPVHHAWIYGLQQGTIFSDGIYPEAMHCFIYTIRVVFGISVYSCELFLAGVYSSVILVSVYLLFKELFTWRGSAVLALTLFLTVDLKYVNAIASMSRLQWTLPQEFGFHTIFLCTLFLIRCMKDPFAGRPKGAKAFLKYLFQNENLFLFQMAFTASFVIHFYVTIIAFFLCFVVVLFYFVRLFRKKRIIYLMAAVFSGLLISVTPMAIAYAQGIPLQGSIGWGLSVIEGENQEETDQNLGETQKSENLTSMGTQQGISSNNFHTLAGQTTVQEKKKPDLLQKIQIAGKRVLAKMKAAVQIVYRDGYVAIYTKERAKVILGTGMAGCGMWLLYRLITGIAALVIKKKAKNIDVIDRWDGGILLIAMSVIVMVAFTASDLGLQSLIEHSRLCSVVQMLICAAVWVPFDMILGLFTKTPVRSVLQCLIPFGVGGIYALTLSLGIFHGYLYYHLSRYNEAVNVTNEIMQNFPEKSYTIISPTDELYQVIEHGYHEEMLLFSQKILGEINYTMPTKYLFFYVEKKPMEYLQYHFPKGPKWLATENYASYFEGISSQGDQIRAGTISAETAKKPIQIYSLLSDSYGDLESREILESRVMEWCKNFQKRFPEDMKVYYEDDAFCCYIIRQNPYRLFQLEEK